MSYYINNNKYFRYSKVVEYTMQSELLACFSSWYYSWAGGEVLLQRPNWAHCFHPSFLQHTEPYFSSENHIMSCLSFNPANGFPITPEFESNPFPWLTRWDLTLHYPSPHLPPSSHTGLLSVPPSLHIQQLWPTHCAPRSFLADPCGHAQTFHLYRASLTTKLNSVFLISLPHSVSHPLPLPLSLSLLIAPTSIWNNLIWFFTCLLSFAFHWKQIPLSRGPCLVTIGSPRKWLGTEYMVNYCLSSE